MGKKRGKAAKKKRIAEERESGMTSHVILGNNSQIQRIDLEAAIGFSMETKKRQEELIREAEEAERHVQKMWNNGKNWYHTNNDDKFKFRNGLFSFLVPSLDLAEKFYIDCKREVSQFDIPQLRTRFYTDIWKQRALEMNYTNTKSQEPASRHAVFGDHVVSEGQYLNMSSRWRNPNGFSARNRLGIPELSDEEIANAQEG